jgi:hypothetical protein
MPLTDKVTAPSHIPHVGKVSTLELTNSPPEEPIMSESVATQPLASTTVIVQIPCEVIFAQAVKSPVDHE